MVFGFVREPFECWKNSLTSACIPKSLSAKRLVSIPIQLLGQLYFIVKWKTRIIKARWDFILDDLLGENCSRVLKSSMVQGAENYGYVHWQKDYRWPLRPYPLTFSSHPLLIAFLMLQLNTLFYLMKILVNSFQNGSFENFNRYHPSWILLFSFPKQ